MVHPIIVPMGQGQPPPPSLRVAQILVAALASGVMLFTAFVGLGPALGLRPAGPAPAITPPNSPGISPLIGLWVAMGFGVLVVWLILRGVLLMQARTKWTSGPQDEAAGRALVQAFVIRTILWAALLEGWGLFGAVTAMTTGQIIILTGPIAAVFAMFVAFPTPARLAAFAARVTGRAVQTA